MAVPVKSIWICPMRKKQSNGSETQISGSIMERRAATRRSHVRACCVVEKSRCHLVRTIILPIDGTHGTLQRGQPSAEPFQGVLGALFQKEGQRTHMLALDRLMQHVIATRGAAKLPGA
mmetsp:Transcript_9173/g.22031  ORF Transcript_9173/g.22031 Transcript_9173/m.22031 type:complete len:119 (+) Transcript_9173:490-846(+)